jgi:type I restriction enzyme R subunit
MPTNTREIGFEEFIEAQLASSHGYRVRVASQFDKALALDSELVLEFVQNTQPEEWQKLVTQYGTDTATQFLARLDVEIQERGVLSVFREGVRDRGAFIRMAFWKPESGMNEETERDYASNILSVMRQAKYSNKNENSIDVVIFLNGLPIFTVELKNQLTRQTVKDAIKQYQTDRDPKEKLLAFKRCLTHFAVDTEQVFMTTALRGLATRFLPFNQGNQNSSGNPVLEGKYKTHYLWEQIWSRDSILELLSHFIHVQVEETEDAKGKKKKVEKLLFPRYHQLDTVRRLIADARDGGAGKNYLIQHSAGSGKSNTIAWTAHRLSELHNSQNAMVFDTVIVVTDRRVLDRQLSETVESFAQVRGVVKHVESSSELREALESGVKIIITTLQKFPVVALMDVIETEKEKKFAVIIDEAHSSQSGESAADLRQVLTLDEAAAQAEEANKAFKTTEDLLIERMKARRVKAPNISFLAFTATSKQKTLELFGVEDALTGKFAPFSLYSMKQAIEEGFILDVLKNYTTYQAYFELLKKVADDPEYNKKKAERLLIGYVERHDHAIDTKVQIMVEHFEEKIADDIFGQAKAMVVTKSRLHAVKYKLAFDKYLSERGYPHRALVAFSGTVRDGKIEYTESQMNGGISEKQTAEEFKKDECRFLIVAEKFQTGFDQPLLEAMYVDKKLSGVNAVQTLSRLNRMAAGKTDTFVLDFVNTTEDIKEAFQPYYTTTILSEGTDPNILNDLERDVLQFKLFAAHEVDGFVEDYMNGQSPDVLNAALDAIVARYVPLLAEEKEAFKSKAQDYIRKYGFIAQIITFEDPRLEKLFIFLKFLVRKLPVEREVLPYEVLEAVNMDSYKVEKKVETKITLDNEDGVIDPMGLGGDGFEVRDERDPLSKIIKDINERFGTAFNTEDKVILNSLSQRLMQNETLEGSIKNNNRHASKIKFDVLFNDELVTMLNGHFDLYKKLDENPELKSYVNDRIFDFVHRKMEEKVR